MALIAVNFAEELQDWIADNYTVETLTVGQNFILGNLLDLQDIADYLASSVSLSMYEEGGNIVRTGRRHHQERSIRFVFKGQYGQEAVNKTWQLLQWLEDQKTFLSSTFRVWLARIDKLPSVIGADQDGIHLADSVVTFFVLYRTG